ncbi:hypothetical protein HO419_03750 [Streptococcus suis]|uniref:Uncharacterized protein n=1 Tax=Streptococcus suis TaxID=1307 RepID=A0A9Q5C2X6_STRSU|nr:hypothetical protein [Streptococcus suis]MCK3849038.1 hypothetical protein [Streptococcus suis]MCK3907474.1 hypothetical protein [Streptococcus suis]MCK3957772.1 hypothetical protein [Streptococcus suis]MCK4018536.1 hypothetical protein [Streptococcus suis]MCK4064494.1 hypothetical protein [Streptococcus suis]
MLKALKSIWDAFRSWLLFNWLIAYCMFATISLYQFMQYDPTFSVLILIVTFLVIFGIPLLAMRLFKLSSDGVLTCFPLLALFLLLIGFPNPVYIIGAMVVLLIKPRGRTVIENIVKSFSTNNLKYLSISLFLPLLVLFFLVLEEGEQVTFVKTLIIRVAVLYIVIILISCVLTYRKSRLEERVKTQAQIRELFELFEHYQITEETYLVICESCSAENFLELGQGQSCSHCGAWLARKEP